MIMNVENAKKLMRAGLKLRKVAEDVNSRIASAAKLGYGHIVISESEMDLVKEMLLDNGFAVNGNYIIWSDETAPRKEEEDNDEDEW